MTVPMRNLNSSGGELIWAGKTLTQLHELAGRTPLYVYDKAAITSRLSHLRKAFPEEIKIHYAIKANPMPEVVKHLATLVDGFDVASAEPYPLLAVEFNLHHCISLAGPGKTNEELLFTVKAGAIVNLESFREIEELGRIQQQHSLQAKVAIRINPGFELKGAGMKMGGGPKPFGIDAEMVPAAIDRIKHHRLSFHGFHVFSGSQNLNFSAIVESQIKSFDLAAELSDSLKMPCQFINLGGGFGIPYFTGEQPLNIQPIAENLFHLVEKAKRLMPRTELVLELGRYLVGEAGIYVCRIIDKKVSRGRTYLVTNGGLHHHLAATGNLGQVIRRSYPIAIGNKLNETTQEVVSIVGPLCTPLDTFAEGISLPKAEPGDYVVLFQSGAYGATASPQQFLSQPKVLEVFV